ncbi:MAG: chloride channel protein, partial [Acidimicrobiales bacterium]
QAPGQGFEHRPRRMVPATLALLALVVFAATLIAHYFKELAMAALEFYADSTDPTVAAASLNRIELFVVAACAVALASSLSTMVRREWSDQVGLEAVAASARGEGRRISLRATALRATATWIVSAGMVSIGRESAIIESGGAVGATAGRRFNGRGDAMAAAGIAAAFAAAYHAPIAALFYVEETLHVRSSPRALRFAVAGSAGGFATSIYLLSGTQVFPPTQGSRWTMFELGLVGLVPAVLVAHGFLQLRTRVTGDAMRERFSRPWVRVALFSALAGAAVAWFPLASGNGMEALRHASLGATVGLALALSIGKLVGTTAALAAGAPGGVLTPTISITGGSVLLVLLGAQSLGLVVANPWDVMVAAVAVGVAIGLRSPLVAVFLIPEFLGDYTLLPMIAVLVGLAVLADQAIISGIERVGQRVPRRVFNEDA